MLWVSTAQMSALGVESVGERVRVSALRSYCKGDDYEQIDISVSIRYVFVHNFAV